jgi:hypothetical protein
MDQFISLMKASFVELLTLAQQLGGFSPRANYTGRLSAKLVPTFANRGMSQSARLIPYGRNSAF